MVAGCSSADPLRGLFVPKPDGLKVNNAFPVKSPQAAAARSGVNPPCTPDVGVSPRMGPGQGWDEGSVATLVPALSVSVICGRFTKSLVQMEVRCGK